MINDYQFFSPASSHGIECLKKRYKIDMKAHRSALLTPDDVSRAFLIIGVSQSHLAELMCRYPEYTHKFRKLDEDVSDPWHQPLASYEACASSLERLVSSILRNILLS